MKGLFLKGLIFFTLTGIATGAEQNAPSCCSDSSDGPFHRGGFETTLAGGILFSPMVGSPGHTTINFTDTEWQFGWMLTDPKKIGFLRGNVELVGDVFGDAITAGKGNYLAGGTAWLRGNWVPENSRIVPFLQVGAGATFTDIDRNVVGQEFNINLDAGAGVRWFFRPNWSLNLEYRYEHISNGGMSSRNRGINAHGPILGVSFFF